MTAVPLKKPLKNFTRDFDRLPRERMFRDVRLKLKTVLRVLVGARLI